MGRNIEELRDLSVDELHARLADAEEELANLVFQNGSGQLDNPIMVRQQRKVVARIRTLIREHEITGAKAAAEAQGEA